MNKNKNLMMTEEGFKLKKSIYCINESAIIVSDMMGGKMEGVPSISTSVLLNLICKARMEAGDSICMECFAKDSLSFKKGLRENCEQNFKLLNARELDSDEFPIFKKVTDMVRIESFGDTASVIHCINYLNLCYANPDIPFSMWTKNPNLWDQAIKLLGKPANLICVLSSEKKNVVTEEYKKYDWVDHVFTVFTLEYVREHDVQINCGGKKCIECRHCYCSTEGKPFFINELLKKDQKKANDVELGLIEYTFKDNAI